MRIELRNGTGRRAVLNLGGISRLRSQPLAPPTRQVRHEHVVAEMQLGLDVKEPFAWRVAEIERITEFRVEHAGGAGMRKGRPREA